jgi:hypothetical protein
MTNSPHTAARRALATLLLLAVFALGFAGSVAAQDDGLDPETPNGSGGSSTCNFTCWKIDSPCVINGVNWHCFAYKCANAACSNTERPCFFGDGICGGAYHSVELCDPDWCASH